MKQLPEPRFAHEFNDAETRVHADSIDPRSGADYHGQELTMTFLLMGHSDQPFLCSLSSGVIVEMHRRMVDALEVMLMGQTDKEQDLQVTQVHND